MLQTIKFKANLNQEQIQLFDTMVDACRLTWNKCKHWSDEHYKETKKSLSNFDLNYKIVELKKDNPWLNDTCAQSLQQTAKEYVTARNTAIKLIALQKLSKEKPKRIIHLPGFRSKKNGQKSIPFSQGIKILTNNKIQLPKFGGIKICKNNLPTSPYQIKHGHLSVDKVGNYWISLIFDVAMEETPKIDPLSNPAGIDMGFMTYLTFSDGTKIDNPRFAKQLKSKLAKAHRRLSRCKVGSNGFEKRRKELAKLYRYLTNLRKNFQHQLTSRLSKTFSSIFMETLDLQEMAKTKSSRSVADASFYQLITFLKYKMKRLGKELIQVDQFYPSTKLCSNCSYKNNNLELWDRNWICPVCSINHDRDHNAAINILNEGLRLMNMNVASCRDETLNDCGVNINLPYGKLLTIEAITSII